MCVTVVDVHHCWVASYGWCVKEQTIDLLQEGCDKDVLDGIKPRIVVSEWSVGPRLLFLFAQLLT